MYIEWQTIITAGGVVSALALMIGIILKIHKWCLKIEENTKRIEELEKHHEDDVQRIKEENCLICFALSAFVAMISAYSTKSAMLTVFGKSNIEDIASVQ